MAAVRSSLNRSALMRIVLNVGFDALLAAVAVPLARWLAAPASPVLSPLWTLPWGAVALLVAGLPFRLSTQYWRFAGAGDLLGK